MHLVLSIALVFAFSIPSGQWNNHTYAQSSDLKVTGEILYLRDGPGLSYPIITTLQQNDELSSIEQDGDWIHVKSGDYEGWVASWLTTSIDKETETEKETESNKSQAKMIVSQVERLNIRSEPALSAVVLGQLSSGQQATVLQENTDWVQITVDGLTGWVSKEYATVNALESEQDNKKETNKNEVKEPSNKGTTTSFEEGVQYFTVHVDALIIRKKTDLNSRKIDTVEKGQSFKILDRQNNWLQIQLSDTKKGWVYSFYGTVTVGHAEQLQDNDKTSITTSTSSQYVTIIYNGTNLREQPSTSSAVVTREDAGKSFPVLEVDGEWYKIQVDDNKIAYVANWVVTVKDDLGNQISEDKDNLQKEERKKGTLKGVSIVVDAGHGGNDHGTTGVRGTDEKDITLKTATLLASKLSAAGADVIMTRESDEYIDLRKRVSVAHQHSADAFISLHYDATEDSSISGFTTYYMNSNQQQLAQYVHEGLSKKIKLRDRGAQQGNYLVLRENRQPSILIELGFLSNPGEERAVLKSQFREQATLGIYKGILNYFDELISE